MRPNTILRASRPDVWAQLNLGLMYRLGMGVPEDYVLAYMWFSVAASGGNEAAARRSTDWGNE